MLKLFGQNRSPATWRVRNALFWKELEFEEVAVDVRRGEHRRIAFLERNPQGMVPVLEHEGVTIPQSLAIIGYLEERFPKHPLLPPDPVERAQIRSLAYFIACDVQPLYDQRLVDQLYRALEMPESEKGRWCRHWLRTGFSVLETYLGQLAGRYAFGSTVTLLDVMIAPEIAQARRYRLDLDDFPVLTRVAENLVDLPAFAKASAQST